jgi:PQQ-dependent dehydrogenase (s-GDH family)
MSCELRCGHAILPSGVGTGHNSDNDRATMRTFSGYGRFVSAVNLVLGLGACSGSNSASDDGTGERDDALQADAAVQSDAGPRRVDQERTRPDAAVSGDAGTSSEAPDETPDAQETKPAAKPEKKKDEPQKPQETPDPAQDAGAAKADAGPPSEDTFALRVVATGLDAPWEITWGPDSQLWIAERTGRIVRVDPATGTQAEALRLTDLYSGSTQDGLLGMALHPQLGQALGNDYVYLAYTYDADASAELAERARLVRYTYDATAHTLASPQTLIEGLPASEAQNAGRLAIGPDNLLYYSIGDQGHNQQNNKCLAIRAQDLPTLPDVENYDYRTYQGKILRLGLDGAIPESNPTLAGVRSHIFSYGHRNTVGLAFGPGGKLYASEQGPKTDDELNLIAAGGNYGWPHVAGYRDDNAYVYANWSAAMPETCDSLTFDDFTLPESVPQQPESAWSESYVTPLRTFYTVDNTLALQDPACAAADRATCWPTIAPASLELYVAGSEGLQTWGTALLIPSLKKGSVLRVKLSADGDVTEGDTRELFKTTNRYRDLTVAPNKRTFYVVTDSEGATSAEAGGSTLELEHRGALLEFSYDAQH